MSDPTLFGPEAGPLSNHLAKSTRLLQVFEDIHNHIYANEGLSSEQAFSEMLKLLFLKVFDETVASVAQFHVSPHELDELAKKGHLLAFQQRMTCLHQAAAAHFSGVLESGDEMALRPSCLAYAVHRLQHLNLSESSRDLKGLAFQKFLHARHRGSRGQFFTPEQVVRLCVEFVKPKAGERILDPTCGTGGFLSQAIERMLEGTSGEKRDALLKGIADKVYGIEINPLVARTAKMRLLLEGAEASPIATADALSDWPAINCELSRAAGTNESYEGTFDVILTNPPFGSQGRIRDAGVLRRFELGCKWEASHGTYRKENALQGSQVPDILFLERCLDFLRPAGRMAIVLPNGNLENSSQAYVRQYVAQRARVLSVVNLPPETFIPSGTGVKASVLFLLKKDAATTSDASPKHSKVFFAKVTKLGYQGNKNGSVLYRKDAVGRPLRDENGEPILDEDVTEIVQAYTTFKAGDSFTETDKVFAVDSGIVCGRFDFDYYDPSCRRLEAVLRDRDSVRLGDIAHIEKKRSPKLKHPELKVAYVELSDVDARYCEISRASEMRVHELPSRASYELREGDIITAVSGNSVGTNKHMSALVAKEYEGAICTNGFRILRPAPSVNPYYLLYYLTTPYFLRQVWRHRTGAAIPAISDVDLASVLVYVPSSSAQEAIADALRSSFKLRQESSRLMDRIELDLPQIPRGVSL